LQPLTITDDTKESYYIRDGDIPCTPEIEPTFSYVWNFCGDVSAKSFPSDVCDPQKNAAVLQYVNRVSDGYKECNIIGHYDASRDDTFFSLLDQSNPAKGVSMKYLYGDKCPGGQLRTATLDVQCSNKKMEIISANEPTKCDYHFTMDSYYGCPLECPVTGNGLCNSHGHCAFDSASKAPHCFCNSGYMGSACDKVDTTVTESGLGVQIGLMVTLLIVCLILVGFVAYLAYQITEFRKAQAMSSSFSGTEMMGNPMH
jgi:hypothetical protein